MLIRRDDVRQPCIQAFSEPMVLQRGYLSQTEGA
jgi:hypothetical protein